MISASGPKLSIIDFIEGNQDLPFATSRLPLGWGVIGLLAELMLYPNLAFHVSNLCLREPWRIFEASNNEDAWSAIIEVFKVDEDGRIPYEVFQGDEGNRPPYEGFLSSLYQREMATLFHTVLTELVRPEKLEPWLVASVEGDEAPLYAVLLYLLGDLKELHFAGSL